MSRRPLRLAAVLLLAVSACTTDAATTTSTAPEPVATTAPPPTDISDLPGRLVVLDGGGDIVALDPDGSNPATITDDAGGGTVYRQPTFSPVADRLAWAEISGTGFGLGMSGGEGEDRVRVPMSSPPFFTFWSPDGSGIGVLHNSTQGATIDFEMVDVAASTSQVLASGAPFFFSWSPDSTQVAAHVELAILATLDRAGETEDLGETADGYQAPHWIPDGIIHLADDGLELRPIGGENRVLATVPGPVSFVANPQGTRVAIQSFVESEAPGIDAAVSPIPALPANRVMVLDVESGEVAEAAAGVSIGLFWSPDGERLLVLRLGAEGTGELTTVVWADGDSTELSSIAPHPLFTQEVLQFFDQYGQSLQLWSPDSTAFALPGAIGDDTGVWVHTLGGGEPVNVTDGSWVSWSNS
ncbi:MAG TPA: hypothetical protein VF083_12935 [Acidimicrobiia bacterium]